MMKRAARPLPGRYKAVLAICLGLIVVLLAVWRLQHTTIAVLQPRGTIGRQERELIIIAALLSVIVVLPVFIMTAVIAWRYRASNTKATYTPNSDHSRAAETTWWLIPSVIILILSVVTWHSSHALDPYKPLNSTVKPMTVQVVALDWKWLFIYPQQNIATVNYVALPANTPVTFDITSDAPMNSFWIPQLGGQIYAMPGMSTELHLEASQVGSFNGWSANISGDGFAGMTFTANAMTNDNFNAWVAGVKQAPQNLDTPTYLALRKPSQNVPRTYYATADLSLYNQIIMQYMMPMPPIGSSASNTPMMNMPGMQM